MLSENIYGHMGVTYALPIAMSTSISGLRAARQHWGLIIYSHEGSKLVGLSVIGIVAWRTHWRINLPTDGRN